MIKKTRLLLVFSLLSTPVWAQQSINTHTFNFSDTLETVQVEDALGPKSELQQYKYLFRASYDFVNESFIGIDPTRSFQEFTVVKKLQTIEAGGAWLINSHLLFGVDVPVHYIRETPEYLTLYGINRDTTAWRLGDIGAHFKWRLTSDESKVNVAIMPYGFFPTGSKAYFTTDDSYGYGGKILLDAAILPFLNLYGNAGYTVASNAIYLNLDRSKRIELAAGAYAKIIGDKVGVNAEVVNAITWPGYGDDQNPIAVRLGGRIRTGIFRWYFGGAFEGLRTARSDDLSLYAGVKVPFGERRPKESEPIEARKEIPSTMTNTVSPPETEIVTVQNKIEILKQNLNVQREISFETNKDIILTGSYPDLNSAAEIIKQYAAYIGEIEIEGHTDSRGSDAFNMDLSQRRANSVKKYLVDQGVPEDKLKAVGYGETRPKVKETGPETLLMNRRVEFKVEESSETQKQLPSKTTTEQKK